MAKKGKNETTEEESEVVEKSWMDDLSSEAKTGILTVLLFALATLAFLSLIDAAGQAGGVVKQTLANLFGWTRVGIPLVFAVAGLILFFEKKFSWRLVNFLGLGLLVLTINGLVELFWGKPETWQGLLDGSGGGYLGMVVAYPLIRFLGVWGALVVLITLLIVSFLLMFNTSIQAILLRTRERQEEILDQVAFKAKQLRESQEREIEEIEQAPADVKPTPIKSRREEAPKDDLGISFKKISRKIDVPLDLLDNKISTPSSGDIRANQYLIRKTLENFNIPVEMGDVSVGPTVTQYTFKPADGIKLTRITSLSNDLALALAAHPIRIEAPIPGKSLVGVEVPNKTVAIVRLREMLSGSTFLNRKSNLTIPLGKDVSGQVWVFDVAKMPHLLVAGATGSGKSVFLNSLIVSLIYQNSPDDLRFIMVDPKRVELTVYNQIPQLLTPVITDVKKTINALKWLLSEMDRRYEVLSQSSHRNIASYNAAFPDKLPYIILVVDELADLMVSASSEIESLIIRLAQMARAVGIHLVLATQRPSVDVITGLIKANITTRIAFSVASLMDSRTILDTSGAEKLVGRGDMLFISSELSKPKRLQAAFVSDQEIQRICDYLAAEVGEPKFVEEVTSKPASGSYSSGFDSSDSDDVLLEEARKLVIQANKASASFLQRRLKVGYARAARLLDLLEEDGVIGPGDGAKPREVLVSSYEVLPDEAPVKIISAGDDSEAGEPEAENSPSATDRDQ